MAEALLAAMLNVSECITGSIMLFLQEEYWVQVKSASVLEYIIFADVKDCSEKYLDLYAALATYEEC